MSKPRIYHYRGQVERWVASRRSYVWRDGYSEDSDDGHPLYPWNTMQECRDEARKDGVRAVFERRP